MLSKTTFANGIKLINAVLGKNCQLDTKDTLDSYYLLLQDLPDELFLRGVTVTGEEFPIKPDDKTFITIRNVPYTELNVLNVSSEPRAKAYYRKT